MWFSRQRSNASRPDDVTFSKHDVMRPQLAKGCVLLSPQNWLLRWRYGALSTEYGLEMKPYGLRSVHPRSLAFAA